MSVNHQPLFVPLASEPYRRFEAGVKTVEVRQHLGRWNERVVHTGRPVLLRRGYSTRDEFRGIIGRVAYASNLWSLPEWAMKGAAFDRPPGAEKCEACYPVPRDRAPAWYCRAHRPQPPRRFLDAALPVLAFEVLR